MGFFKSNTVTKRVFTNTPWKLNLGKDIGEGIPCYFSVLHDLTPLWQTSEFSKDNGNLAIHFVKGQPKAPICDHLYSDDEPAEDAEPSVCEFCLMLNSFGDPNSPVLVKPLLVYVYSLQNETVPSADGTKEYPVDPVKIFELTCGSKKINFEKIEEAHIQEYLSIYQDKTIFQTKKLDKGIAPPSIVSAQELKGLGKQFSPEVPKDILDKYRDLSAGELMGLLLDSYGNVKKDHKMFTDLGVVWPAVVDDSKKDKKTKDNKPAGKSLDK